ncbi:prepilin-type N-terminal cleavage/methylation domain-containing protein [Methylosinus sp. H3A]|uniref:prepilin-type N-terminal cleavage/methylation domain-containing protein n=1 Tax=Methylosinus sp. H3A TaxID=2785786 RepID=UPI0018C268E1|nr:prepilin-type N-terminal cleavage/methylation domain-containing protein [Methylosinus sp. H3A]MBG0808326.1 prepilin-type N-terminal cleavage/methylation domain-containing protein [Methylosinus sp. H3A]
MRPPFARGAARRSGFSLLEMLAVLAIVALLGGMASQFTRRPSPRLRVESATRALCSGLRATRLRAIATASEQALTIDLRRRAFFSMAVAATALPEDAAIELAVSERQRAEPSRAAIVFFPHGGSSGGGLTIALSGARAEIAVNWLTGATRCAFH